MNNVMEKEVFASKEMVLGAISAERSRLWLKVAAANDDDEIARMEEYLKRLEKAFEIIGGR